MSAAIRISRAAPLVTLQDAGRFGFLQHGVSASGPMDRGAYTRVGERLGKAGETAIEFTRAGLAFTVEGGKILAAFDGGSFSLSRNGVRFDSVGRIGGIDVRLIQYEAWKMMCPLQHSHRRRIDREWSQ